MMIIGIDFGTCFSSVAVMSGMVPDTSLLRDSTGYGMPSAFLYDPEKRTVVCGEACDAPEYYPMGSQVIRHVKRTIRADPSCLNVPISSGGRSFTYPEIIRHYIRFLVEAVKDGAAASGSVANTDVEAVAVTVPVGIIGGKMMAFEYNRLVMDAVKDVTGLPEGRIHIIQEPVAAALSYVYANGAASGTPRKENVLVFDLGGGTLDVTVVDCDPRSSRYDVRAKEGVLDLGGNDWDDVLADMVKRRTDTPGFTDPTEEARFRGAVTKLKVDLSQSDEAAVFFKCGGRAKIDSVTRNEFEEAASGLVDRAMTVAARAVHAGWVSIARPGGSGPSIDFTVSGGRMSEEAREAVRAGLRMIDRVVLVGGGSNVPSIRDALVSVLGVDEAKIVRHNPSKAIAMGAGIYAKLMSDAPSTSTRPVVSDILSHTYGFITAVDGKPAPLFVRVLTYRGTRFPQSGRIKGVAEHYSPLFDEVETTGIRLIECELDRSDTENDYALYEDGMAIPLVVAVPTPPDYRGRAAAYSFNVELETDANGLLEITVRDAATGRKAAFGTNRPT